MNERLQILITVLHAFCQYRNHFLSADLQGTSIFNAGSSEPARTGCRAIGALRSLLNFKSWAGRLLDRLARFF